MEEVDSKEREGRASGGGLLGAPGQRGGGRHLPLPHQVCSHQPRDVEGEVEALATISFSMLSWPGINFDHLRYSNSSADAAFMHTLARVFQHRQEALIKHVASNAGTGLACNGTFKV